MSATCDLNCCDFCRFYNWGSGDTRAGIYMNDGRCEHPAHPRPADPGDGCDDVVCSMCAPALPVSGLPGQDTGGAA